MEYKTTEPFSDTDKQRHRKNWLLNALGYIFILLIPYGAFCYALYGMFIMFSTREILSGDDIIIIVSSMVVFILVSFPFFIYTRIVIRWLRDFIGKEKVIVRAPIEIALSSKGSKDIKVAGERLIFRFKDWEIHSQFKEGDEVEVHYAKNTRWILSITKIEK